VSAVAGDFQFVSPVFAALATIRLVIGYGAPAGRMSTFLGFEISHSELPFLFAEGTRSASFIFVEPIRPRTRL
jgi:hypothetical protein